MPCYLKRAYRLRNRLKVGIPTDEAFEKQVMRALGVGSHRDLAGVIEAMPEEAFIALMEGLVRRRRKSVRVKGEQEQQVAEVPYIS